MSGKNYLLDTNIVIFSFKDPGLKSKIESSNKIFIPSIVIGELYYGAEKSSKKKENIQRIELLIKESIILNCDEQTGKLYGKIKAQLRKKGNPIPENDIWIAAIAEQNNLVLVSQDVHFKHIDSIKTIMW